MDRKKGRNGAAAEPQGLLLGANPGSQWEIWSTAGEGRRGDKGREEDPGMINKEEEMSKYPTVGPLEPRM